jgi:hypothetical protein
LERLTVERVNATTGVVATERKLWRSVLKWEVLYLYLRKSEYDEEEERNTLFIVLAFGVALAC